jgi:hypothetical protein
LVRIQPDPPHGSQDHRGGLAQLGEHLLCKQGVVGSIPTSSTTTSKKQSFIGCVVHFGCRPKRLSRNRRAFLVCHASGCCSLTIYRNRIEKSLTESLNRGKGLPDTVPSTIFMIASTDIFIFEVCEYDEFERQTRNTQTSSIQTIFQSLTMSP